MKQPYVFILKYVVTWVIVSLGYFFMAEKITKWIAPGFDNEMIWLYVLVIGLVMIFAVTIIAFIIGLRKKRKHTRAS